MKELSVIVPFVNEYPQVVFTLQSIAQELEGRVDYEIIAVDNQCDQVKEQGYEPDKSTDAVKGGANRNERIKYASFSKNLSHWQAKRIGVDQSEGEFIWFCDSHCVIGRDSLYKMFTFYKYHHKELNGTIHLPLTYKILESRRLIYKLVTWGTHVDPPEDYLKTGCIDYSFTYLNGCMKDRGIDKGAPFFEVPCMSTCGMLMSREVYNEVGGWPLELGIYSGGEHFMNFTLAVLGKSKYIFPGGVLFHHGEKRGYHYVYDDSLRNRLIASYIFGGKEWAKTHSLHMKGKPEVLEKIYNDVISKCSKHRDFIRQRQVTSIIDWARKWRG